MLRCLGRSPGYLTEVPSRLVRSCWGVRLAFLGTWLRVSRTSSLNYKICTHERDHISFGPRLCLANMPRKVSVFPCCNLKLGLTGMLQVRVPVSRDESREAQQRSRARHKEYVTGLERRLAEYEQQGVSATLEMQRAARAVATKNERLMALLALRGVAQHEIDVFLAEPASRQLSSAYQAQTVPQAMPIVTSNPPLHIALDEQHVTMAYSERKATHSQQEARGGGCGKQSSCGSRGSDISAPEQAISQPNTPAKGSAGCESFREETSCEEAASIIASLRGHGDVAEARQALGCADSLSCSVKNTDLFQLMNDMP